LSISRRFLLKFLDAMATMHAYMIMLLSMSFSVEIFAAIVVGLTLGRGLFVSATDMEASSQTLCCRSTLPIQKKSTGEDNIAAESGSRVTVNVGGMTCRACSRTVEQCLRSSLGVRSAQVFLLDGKAEVVFDSAVVSAAGLCEAIESVGFNASIEQEVSEASPATRQTLYRLEMSIEGMTCAACSGAVERCLLALDGVSSASVSLLQGRAEVFFDREVIDASAVSEAVEDIGFDALVLRSFRPSISDQSVVTAIGARGKGTDVPSKPYMGRQLGRPFKSQFEEPLLIADVAQP
jgi:copper ion binding protein